MVLGCLLNLHRAEMNHRTGPGRFKKVMWYYLLAEYGNDIVNRPVEAWKRTHPEDYIRFVKRLLPCGF